MSIRRAPRPEQSFYILDKSISEDPRLSWAARGVLIFLLGKPDNWIVSVAHLIEQTKAAIGKRSSRDAVRAILKELENVGYLVADQERNATGNFSGMAYTVNEVPAPPQTDYPLTGSPQTDNPLPDKPSPENPPLISTDLLVSTEKTTSSPDGSHSGADIFNQAATFSSSQSSSSSGMGASFAATSAAAMDSSSTQDNLSGADPEVLSVPKKIGKKTAKGVDLDMLAIPDWLPVERLAGFIDNRKDLKKPMTQRAAVLLINELTKLKLSGHDPLACMDTAILKNWSSVYPPHAASTLHPRTKFDPRAYVNNHGSSTGGEFHDNDTSGITINVTPERMD